MSSGIKEVSPRPRKAGSQDLPPNLHSQEKGGRRYFFYSVPARFRKEGQASRISLGTDRETAIFQAVEANRELLHLEKYGLDLMSQVKASVAFGDFIDRFENVILPNQDLAESTLAAYKRKLAKIREEFGHLDPASIDVLTCGEFLQEWDNKPTSRNQYRSLLIHLFKYAVSEGILQDNPAEKTLKAKAIVKRRRLSLAEYQAIHSLAPPFIQRGMDLALHTLQRREDVTSMQFQNLRNGVLEVVQKKTGAALRIHTDEPLEAVIARCRDSVLSPWIIHYPRMKTTGAGNVTGRKVTGDTLSRYFRRARDASGLFDSMDMAERPTFHEIRALGAWLYKEAGIDPQSLLGHKDAKMTEIYLSRREVKWTEATGGLDL